MGHKGKCKFRARANFQLAFSWPLCMMCMMTDLRFKTFISAILWS